MSNPELIQPRVGEQENGQEEPDNSTGYRTQPTTVQSTSSSSNTGDTKSLFVSCKGVWLANSGSPQMGIDYQEYRSTEQCSKETLTPETMLTKYILQEHKRVVIVPCSTIVCGMENCGKTTAIEQLLSTAVKLKDERQPVTPLLERPYSQTYPECMSCYKVILLGDKPYDELTWLVSSGFDDNTAMCLLSYFANMCKLQHHESSGEKSNTLLEFTATQEQSEEMDPLIASHIRDLYAQLVKLWKRLKEDPKIQNVLPQGLALLNLLDVGPSQAAKELLPFINQYCSKAVHIACYDSQKDYTSLITGNGGSTHYGSKKYQLLRQLCGITEQKPLILGAIGEDSSKTSAAELKELICDSTDIKNITRIDASADKICNSKKLLEGAVKNACPPNSTSLRCIVLMYIVKRNYQSFWIRRNEIEAIAKALKFTDESLEECLIFFSSFGSIFYTHDIPSLKRYVITDIVKFVKYIHDHVYNTQEVTEQQYGLFSQTNDADKRIVFEFMTTLGIAAEVKSSQILIEPEEPIVFEDNSTVIYIPSVLKSHEVKHVTDDTPANCSAAVRSLPLLRIDGHTKEHMHVCLCNCLLSRNSFLIPTTKVNTTAIRFFNLAGIKMDVKFIDTGNTVFIESLENDVPMDAEKKSAIFNLINHPETHITLRKDLVQRMKSGSLTEKAATSSISSKKMYKIAKIISEIDKTRQEDFSCALKFKKDHIERKIQEEDGDVTSAIIGMLEDFETTNTTDELIEILVQFDTKLKNLLN